MNSLLSITVILATLAPATLRMPISLVFNWSANVYNEPKQTYTRNKNSVSDHVEHLQASNRSFFILVHKATLWSRLVKAVIKRRIGVYFFPLKRYLRNNSFGIVCLFAVCSQLNRHALLLPARRIFKYYGVGTKLHGKEPSRKLATTPTIGNDLLPP